MDKTKKWLTKRQLQITLAILWIVDGLFQLQPKMFTRSFVDLAINPSIQSQPVIIANLMHFFGQIFLLNPFIFNLSIFAVQIAIGALILNKKTVKQGLYLSIVWGLFIWIVGEGLGGIFAGQANLIIGAPGSALLYVILAIAALPRKQTNNNLVDYPAYWLIFVWFLLWSGFGVLQLILKSDSLNTIRLMILDNAHGAPSYIRAIDINASSILTSFIHSKASISSIHSSMMSMNQPTYANNSNGYWFIVILSLIQVLIAIGVFAKNRLRQVAIYSGIILAFIFWVIGQNFGQYYSGFATDLNTAPLIIILGIAIINNKEINRQLARILAGLEKILT